MGLLDFFRRKGLSATPAVVEALQDRRLNPYPALGGTNTQRITSAYQRGIDASYGWIYATQPAVRSVVDFIARNIAQLSLDLYEKKAKNKRKRVDEHPALDLMADPDGQTTGSDFLYRFITDYLIWDNAYGLKLSPPSGGRMFLVRLLPSQVTVSGGAFQPDVYVVWRYDGSYFEVPPEAMLHWHGYNPDDPLLGLSKLEALRYELATDRAIQAALVELAKSGLKGGYIERPLDAPEASHDDLKRIAELWKQMKLLGDPILDEGMKYVPTGLSPKDAEIIASRRFTEETVAQVYGVPMAAMGGPDSGNAEEQRQLVYTDVLPPITQRLVDKLTQSLLRDEFSEDKMYFAFDHDEKLRGDPSKRFAALTSAAGRPWLTVNEVREIEDRENVEDGDELTIPNNVTLAGDDEPRTNPLLPAPNVMPPQDPNKPPQDGSFREQPKSIETAIVALFDRQERSFAPHRRFDRERFTAEFTKDVAALINATADDVREVVVGMNDGLEKALVTDPEGYRGIFDGARARAPQLAEIIARAAESARGDNLERMKAIGVPDEVLWERAGFDEAEIDRMRALRLSETLLAGESGQS